MRLSPLALASVAALAACAPLVLTPGGARVEVAASVPAACQRVGHVEGSAGYNGKSSDDNLAAVEVYLRNEAAARGGDRIVYTSRRFGARVTDTLSEPTGARESGGCPNCVVITVDAYRCSAQASPGAASAPTRPPASPPPVEASLAAMDAAIAAASESARQCQAKGGPTGQARVRVTFAETGDVVYTEVENEPFAGTAAGDCVARKFRNAHVPPWTGPAASRSVIVHVGE